MFAKDIFRSHLKGPCNLSLLINGQSEDKHYLQLHFVLLKRYNFNFKDMNF